MLTVWGVGRGNRARGSAVTAESEWGFGNASNRIRQKTWGGERPGILSQLYHIWNVDFNLCLDFAPFIPPAFENAVIYLYLGGRPHQNLLFLLGRGIGP